jgi:hypothetical protein
MPKGQENVDEIIDTCRDIIATLDNLSSAGNVNVGKATEQITGMIEGLQEISGKFFLKSNPSIPPSTACLKSARELSGVLQTYAGEQDSTKFLTAMENFNMAFESLAQKASMRSTVIT